MGRASGQQVCSGTPTNKMVSAPVSWICHPARNVVLMWTPSMRLIACMQQKPNNTKHHKSKVSKKSWKDLLCSVGLEITIEHGASGKPSDRDRACALSARRGTDPKKRSSVALRSRWCLPEEVWWRGQRAPEVRGRKRGRETEGKHEESEAQRSSKTSKQIELCSGCLGLCSTTG